MPFILWRYLLRDYLKVLCLSVCTFVFVLIISRFKEIARFAALSGDGWKIGLFLLYQIPFILPLAIPISALVSSFLLFQRLSRSYELVALRASGLSFFFLTAPLFTTAFLLSCLNFSFCADISPFCWRESKALLYRETSVNPLFLMQRQNLIKIKHAYLKMDVKKEGKEAADFILIVPNGSNQRLHLFAASRLQIGGSKLFGYQLSILSHLCSNDVKVFDPLCLENQSEMSTEAPVLSSVLKKNRPRLEANALSFRMLRLRMQDSAKQALTSFVEILRRFSLSLAVLTFTFLGIAFGIQTERATSSKKELFYTMLLTLPTLMAYLGLKAIKTRPILAILSSLFPHCLIFCFSVARIYLVARGKA